ncbi:amino acid ABC transporter permease, partial [Pseudomonas syringae pv. tagetis]
MWTAREVIWSGLLTSFQWAALAIAAGEVIGVVAGRVRPDGG